MMPTANINYNINFGGKPKPARATAAEVIEKIDQQTMFLLAYVPYVASEIAWDYADSCICMAAAMSLKDTKPLCRTIRNLRNDYNKERWRFIDAEHREKEVDNSIDFQEDYKSFFSQLSINIKGAVLREHPDLDEDSLLLIGSAYCCATVLKALFAYHDKLVARVEAKLGKPIGKNLLFKQIIALDRLILQFAGNDSIGGDNKFPDFLKTFVDALANYLAMAEIIPITNND